MPHERDRSEQPRPGALYYRGTRLAPGSEALRLAEEGKFDGLKAHMTRLDREADERGDVPLTQPKKEPTK